MSEKKSSKRVESASKREHKGAIRSESASLSHIADDERDEEEGEEEEEEETCSKSEESTFCPFLSSSPFCRL